MDISTFDSVRSRELYGQCNIDSRMESYIRAPEFLELIIMKCEEISSKLAAVGLGLTSGTARSYVPAVSEDIMFFPNSPAPVDPESCASSFHRELEQNC